MKVDNKELINIQIRFQKLLIQAVFSSIAAFFFFINGHSISNYSEIALILQQNYFNFILSDKNKFFQEYLDGDHNTQYVKPHSISERIISVLSMAELRCRHSLRYLRKIIPSVEIALGSPDYQNYRVTSSTKHLG